MRKRLVITGSMLRSREVEFKGKIAQNLKETIWPLLACGDIKPVIHSVFAAADAGKAHELMESSTHIGKIILNFEHLEQ
jgi:NADPH2:quinone reductase